MCWQMALGIGTTVLGHVAGVQAADAQNQHYMNNAAAANADAVEKYAAEQLALIQKEAQATEQRNALRRATVEATGSALASSENFGQSANLTLLDVERQRARQSHTVDVNVQNERIQSGANMEAIKAENENRINSVQTASAPDLISSVIAGLGSTLGSFDGSRKNKDVGNSLEGLTPLSALDPRNMEGA